MAPSFSLRGYLSRLEVQGCAISEKCRTISFFKNVQKYGYHLKKHTELWVPFWENIAKSLEGEFSINKMNVQLEMKV